MLRERGHVDPIGVVNFNHHIKVNGKNRAQIYVHRAPDISSLQNSPD
jgi:hypothetical protein